jgi:ferredoxin
MNELQDGDALRRGSDALAKTAALLAAAALPAPEPVPAVGYTSAGNTLIIGSATQVLPWAEQLSGQLAVTVLLTGDEADDSALPARRQYRVLSGGGVAISGWLGAFKVSWQQAGLRHEARFDLILDLSPTPLIAVHQPPQGYFAPGSDESRQRAAASELAQLVGDFEKPTYFRYKERLCAHSRNRKVGCSACIEVCSAKAIGSGGDRIKVNPHLCAGCGACTTVCPSGALGYAYPGAPYTGRRLQTVLTAYANAGGAQPVILLHDKDEGSELIAGLGRLADSAMPYRGVPAHMIPLDLQHTASAGIDVWLAAVAYGASGIVVLMTDREAPQYVAALTEQMAIAQTVLSGLGYAGVHFQLIRSTTPEQLDSALQRGPRGAVPQQPATFHVAPDKRNTLDLVLGHLYRNAPLRPEQIALPAGAPFGAIEVNRASCSLCMACVGACPEAALMDSPNAPQLRFVEKNCVQCGLCAETCPEDAIALVPRISFAETWNKAVLLHESEPFYCIRCNKPFGTLQMIENMLAKLSAHSAFSGHLDRIRMCGDCRVVDMMQAQREVTIVEHKRR